VYHTPGAKLRMRDFFLFISSQQQTPPKRKKVSTPYTHLSWERLYDVSLKNEYSLYNSTPSVHAQNNKKAETNFLLFLAVVIFWLCIDCILWYAKTKKNVPFKIKKKKGLLFFVWATTQLCGRESFGWWTNLLWVYIYIKYTFCSKNNCSLTFFSFIIFSFYYYFFFFSFSFIFFFGIIKMFAFFFNLFFLL